jgi:hypothetical protein
MDAEEAVEIVRRGFSWPLAEGGSAPLAVHEFDLGFVVYPKYPAPAPPPPGGPPCPPKLIGVSAVVVDRETGETQTLPLYSPEGTAELYRSQRAMRVWRRV